MKVFLSSTYLDLIEHRKEAAEALARLGHHIIGMETFNARTDDPTKASLKEVAECEIFVGIYAHRYGSLIGKAEISVTEQEFDCAVKQGKEIFAFFVDEDFSWPPKMVDKDAKQIKKLSSFKKKIVDCVTPDHFTDKTDLAYKIVSAVKSHIARTEPPSNIRYSPTKPTGSTLPNQPHFFGRERELAIIADAVSPESRTWGALIDGPGGIGKTALAIRAAHLAPITLFERKIFITAKVRELTPEGEKPLKDFSRDNYFSMLNELALELGEEGIPRLAPDERANPLRMAMAGKKTLIIFDNLETLSEAERTRLFQFLSRLPEGNKAIVTSRRRADVDARVIRLDRLSADESLQLMAELAKNNPRLGRESEKARCDLYEITNGNPLLIKWVCGQLGREGSAMHTIAESYKFIENAPEGNVPLEYIFGDLLETFTESEMKVLAALTHFTQPARLRWITDMTGLPEQAAETALEDLADRSILIGTMEVREFYLPPLAAQFIRSRRPKAVNETGNRLVDRVYALVMENGWDEYDNFHVLDAEWPTITAALRLLLASENDRLQNLCSALFQFCNFTGKWDDSIELNQQAEQKALSVNDINSAGWCAYQAGWVYYLRGQAPEVLACAKRAKKYWENSQVSEKVIGIRLSGLGYTLEKNYSAAIDAYQEALDLWRAINPDSEDVTMILNSLGKAKKNSGQYKVAERDFREALRIAKKVNYREGIADSTGNLADLALHQKRLGEAEEIAREALMLAEKIGRQELIANNSCCLAKVLLYQGHPLEGLSYAQRAVAILAKLRSPELQEAKNLLGECEKAVQYG